MQQKKTFLLEYHKISMDNNVISIDEIQKTLESICHQVHKDKERQQVKRHSDRICMACVLCGDSKDNSSKKRGNLYLKNFRYVCYNCDTKITYIELLETFGYQISAQEKLKIVETLDHYQQSLKWDDDEFITNSLDKLLDIEELMCFNTDPTSRITQFSPVKKDSKVYQYLVNRGIFDHTNIYQAEYRHTDKWKEPVLVNLNAGGTKVVGIQLRNLKADQTKRFFKIITFSELYHMVKGVELDPIEAYGYDKLSQLYNVLTVDWTSPITVFEGYLDTKFFPNAIGCVGTNTDTNLLMQDGVNLRFFYDADATGQRKAEKHLKINHPVFLWEKLFEAWSKTSVNPYNAYRKLKANVKDLNDIAKIIKNPYKILNLEKYFSIDRMDLLWIKK